jgi:hypothetical protein
MSPKESLMTFMANRDSRNYKKHHSEKVEISGLK